jgi:hypothetical protein
MCGLLIMFMHSFYVSFISHFPQYFGHAQNGFMLICSSDTDFLLNTCMSLFLRHRVQPVQLGSKRIEFFKINCGYECAFLTRAIFHHLSIKNAWERPQGSLAQSVIGFFQQTGLKSRARFFAAAHDIVYCHHVHCALTTFRGKIIHFQHRNNFNKVLRRL